MVSGCPIISHHISPRDSMPANHNFKWSPKQAIPTDWSYRKRLFLMVGNTEIRPDWLYIILRKYSERSKWPYLVHVWYAMPAFCCHYRRKFRSQTSDNMDRWKAEQGRGREKRKIRRKKSRRERVRRKKMQMREKAGKSRNTVFFQWFVAPEGQKSRLAKAAGAEPAGQMSDEKLHAVVARSRSSSQNVQNTPAPDHFWKLRCRKSARRCGAKHISKSKCTKHTRSGPLLAVEMSKKCTPLWREAHFQVKMHKTHHLRTTFGSWDVEKVHAVVARSTFPSQNAQNTTCSRHFWKFKSWKSARRCGAKHISKWKCTKH